MTRRARRAEHIGRVGPPTCTLLWVPGAGFAVLKLVSFSPPCFLFWLQAKVGSGCMPKWIPRPSRRCCQEISYYRDQLAASGVLLIASGGGNRTTTGRRRALSRCRTPETSEQLPRSAVSALSLVLNTHHSIRRAKTWATPPNAKRVSITLVRFTNASPITAVLWIPRTHGKSIATHYRTKSRPGYTLHALETHGAAPRTGEMMLSHGG